MILIDALKVYEEECLATQKRSDKWRYHARQFVQRWGMWAPMSSVLSVESFRCWLGDMRQRKDAAQTIRCKAALLKACCRIANEHGDSIDFPTRLLSTVKVANARTEWITSDKEEKLKTLMHKSDWDILDFFLKTGFRSQEGWRLRTDDIDFTEGTITVRRYKTAQLGESVVFEMSPKVRAFCLKAHKAGKEFVLNPVGLERYECRINLGEYWKATRLRSAFDIVGIKGSLHTVRHTVGTKLANAGKDILIISKVLGQRCLKSTQRYCHPHKKAIKSALESL